MLWHLLRATWETALSFLGMKSWVFPAPSHIIDSLLSLLDMHTAFGDPIRQGWPWPGQTAGGISTGVIRSPLIEANIVSGIRLIVGFCLSILLGGTLGVLMWRFKTLDEF